MATKRTKITLGLVAALVVAAIAGPIVYAKLQDDPPAPLAVVAGVDDGDAEATIDGSWKVSDGSQAGYRVDEVLNGQDVTVVGRTDEVTGTAEVEDTTLTEAEVVVDTASVATDRDSRDSYYRDRAMKVDEFPEAVFTLGEPIEVPALGADPAEVEVEGTLQLTDVTNEVTATVQVVRTADGVAASGNIPITFADFGINAPNLGFVKVEDQGAIEFLINLEPA